MMIERPAYCKYWNIVLRPKRFSLFDTVNRIRKQFLFNFYNISISLSKLHLIHTYNKFNGFSHIRIATIAIIHTYTTESSIFTHIFTLMWFKNPNFSDNTFNAMHRIWEREREARLLAHFKLLLKDPNSIFCIGKLSLRSAHLNSCDCLLSSFYLFNKIMCTVCVKNGYQKRKNWWEYRTGIWLCTLIGSSETLFIATEILVCLKV